MNLIKIIFAISLIAICLPFYAKPVKIQCSDKTIEYDEQILQVLGSDVIKYQIAQNKYWNGSSFELKNNATISLSIDSKGLALIVAIAQKDYIEAFSFIDSLDEQAFQLLCLYANALKPINIGGFLKYKMLKNPKLQKVAKASEDLITNFIAAQSRAGYNNITYSYETYASKYLNANYPYNYHECTTDSIHALIALVHFYQETMKKPLPINTDHLKKIFNAQPHDIQQILVNKNLVIVS